MKAKLTNMKRKKMAIDVNLEKNMKRRFMTTCTNQEKNMKRKVMVGGANQKKHEMEGNGNMFKL